MGTSSLCTVAPRMLRILLPRRDSPPATPAIPATTPGCGTPFLPWATLVSKKKRSMRARLLVDRACQGERGGTHTHPVHGQGAE